MTSVVLEKPVDVVPLARRWSFIDDDRPVGRVTLIACALAIVVLYALLWSPYWFPLADSALYLSLARSLASGEGMKFMGLPYKRITSGTPLLLSWIMRCGGGIGAIHGVFLMLTLGTLGFMFITMRRWTNERVALLSVIACAAEFWVFRNVIFIMTEPPFMFFVWAGLYALTRVAGAGGGRKWVWVILGLALMSAAFQNRWAATVFFLPGALAAVWMNNRNADIRARLAWIGLFWIVFGLMIWEFNRTPEGPVVTEDVYVSNTGGRGERAKANEELTERFEAKVFQGVKGPWYKKALWAPVLAGRWVNEGFVAGGSIFFPKEKAGGSTPKGLILTTIGITAALIALACCLVGWWVLLRRGNWWIVGMVAYAVPFWVNWGTRVHPRYIAPIAPLIFVLLCTGLTYLLSVIGTKLAKTRELLSTPWLIRALPAAILIVIVLGNGFVYGVELYIRHSNKKDFYDYAKRGAFAELVDIGAYLQKHAEPQAIVWTNYGGLAQRVGHFLSGRRIELPLNITKADLNVRDPDDLNELHRFLAKVPGKHAIVFSSQVVGNSPIPDWHLPLNKPPMSFWRLYELDEETGEFRRIIPEKNREYVQAIPPQATLVREAASADEQFEEGDE